MLAICAGIAVGIMVAIGGNDGERSGLRSLPDVQGEVAAEAGLLLSSGDGPALRGVHEDGEQVPLPLTSPPRIVIPGLSTADGEPEVTAAAVEPMRDIVEPTPVPVGDAVERWRPLVASIFPEFAVDDVLRVIRCESGGDPNATGHAGEMGLLQIHPRWHYDATYDPEGNLRAGYRISSGGNDWSAWTCRP